MNQIIARKILGKSELTEIKQLEDICKKAEREGLNMKLNWEMLTSRTGFEADDFLYYEGDRLIGYLGMYEFGRDEIEITGMVHPDFRRRGIFSELYETAKSECKKRKIGKILLVTERKISNSRDFVNSVKGVYGFSEYKMVRDNLPAENVIKHGIILKKASDKDKSFLLKIDEICFGKTIDKLEEMFAFADERSLNTSYIGELDGIQIGKIRAVIENNNGCIYGFGVLSELRGRGYGREILVLAINELIKNNIDKVILEVESANDRALKLYKSCGFVEETIYDYYQIKL